MNGIVDADGRALIEVQIGSSATARRVWAWIDTGFTGELVLPQSVIDELSLPLLGTVGAVLADGSSVVMERYDCLVDWFDKVYRLEVVANKGAHPLLGVGLLLDHELRIDYRTRTLTID